MHPRRKKCYFKKQMKLFSAGLFLFLFLCPLFACGAVDYSGFFRVRGGLSPAHKSRWAVFSQTLNLKGVLRPDERFHTSFWIRSSPEWGGSASTHPFQIYAGGDWHINDSLTVRLGRAPYDTSLHQAFSQNDYELYPSLFEGGLLSYSTAVSDYHFWGGRFSPPVSVARGGAEAQGDFGDDSFSAVSSVPTDGGRYSVGVNLNVKIISAFLNRVLFHLVYLTDDLSADAEKATRLGLSLRGNITRFNVDYSVLTVFHGEGLGFKFGENMQHVSFGYSRADRLNSYVFAGYHRDSPQYDPWLYDRHENAGLLDILQWGNLTYFLLGYKAKVQNWFDVEARCYLLRSTDTGPIKWGSYGALITDNDEVSPPERPLGWEMDIQLMKNLGTGFTVTLLGGVFIYEEAFKTALKADTHYSRLQLSAKYLF